MKTQDVRTRYLYHHPVRLFDRLYYGDKVFVVYVSILKTCSVRLSRFNIHVYIWRIGVYRIGDIIIIGVIVVWCYPPDLLVRIAPPSDRAIFSDHLDVFSSMRRYSGFAQR